MYFKILNDDLNHNGFQYTEGLNVDVNKFDETPSCGGGLFFSDEKNIMRFCEFGNKIAAVEVPDNETIINCNDKYKAHSIILSDIRELWTIDTFVWLFKNGVDIHAMNDYALRWAAGYGHLDVVKYLVMNGADIHTFNDDALRLAANYGYLDVVKYLVENGADIHARNNCALRWAAGKGYLDIVKYLVEHGANIHALNNCALRWAAENGYLDVVKYLVKYI